MNQNNQTRIDQAWQESQDWIAEFDGTPHIALLLDADTERIYPAFEELAAETENLRVTSIPVESGHTPQFIPLEALPQHLEQQKEEKLEELSINYARRVEVFDLDVRLIIHRLEGKLALELLWWSDQVFSEETDNRSQFHELAQYFIYLQQKFGAQNLFISPESGRLSSDEGVENWVEI
jgi:hypothetical protein